MVGVHADGTMELVALADGYRESTVRPAQPAMLLTVTGGAGAGKTTLAAALAGQRDPVTVLHLDDYYRFTDRDRGI